MIVRFPVSLSTIRAHKDDFESAICQVHVRVEILQGLQQVLAGRTPVCREEKANVLESVKALGCYRLGHICLLALSLCRATLLDEGISYHFLNALAKRVFRRQSEIGHCFTFRFFHHFKFIKFLLQSI